MISEIRTMLSELDETVEKSENIVGARSESPLENASSPSSSMLSKQSQMFINNSASEQPSVFHRFKPFISYLELR